ncbi:Acetylornithine deacetylase/Succinyl-diaminopimelate desuccinylase [Desulfatibacillum alkenivorans DSM 16219]|jgi:acetylornithine deacetylase/succinyl-diaminopimelate desuccinylase-like protein|uniref:Acetylornithine deacetylase/Succinyl-diaminopimelate desuccinylase n=1 Tax=Desulfatibacillum alkenivorans DSM 16219 TaxID=1121393 RepID=A0A1M6RMP6_9BACT|nr:M20/M25/M40 family metallo-hydrolase [Desulfatibacillum alkenivorans]SHK33714.1 Acetylornithine deacetylase/Succinyl-diaminopimelate desuccinylase [Desulfatibacillum alkenivorans DSM 16219]
MTHEAIQLLSEYLRINTTNPPGNEGEAAGFLEKVLIHDEASCKIYSSHAGRASLKAVLPGTGEKPPLILLNHMDVVPADPSEWSFDPFSGEIKDGFVHGRGALDMKGLGILELVAFLELKRKGVELCRDLIFLAVADEETGGAHGARFLTDNYLEDFAGGVVINEGGFGVKGILPTKTLHMISTAEKGPCWLKLSRAGLPGHGSMPHGQNALEELVKALNRLLTVDRPLEVAPVVGEYFKNMACEWDFLAPYVEDGNPDTLVRILTETGLAAMPQLGAMLKNTISLNLLRAGESGNVIPSKAVAQLDARLLPGQDADEFVGQVKEWLADDAVEVEKVMNFPATSSPLDHPDYLTIKDALQKRFPEDIVTPSLTAGTTDSRFFRAKGMEAYGVFPVTVPMEHLKMIHGIDEKISEENLVQGAEAFTDVVLALCKAG